MMRPGLVTFAVSCSLTVIGSAVAADEKASNQTSLDGVQSYGQHNKECLEWTDTCVNCVRTQSGGDYSCSNVGVACQPKQVECLRHPSEKAK